ncbi:hypothetical protein [Mucilaginibacter phyllosphaerae]|uniref:Uncharacterized protein n=1 Tax=Mucilaginibacter phyllosphaerae TaxID=1812349 RepID=A0A4Y8AE86_9SPHI|nr:hypothetical protein [Mucilaginibacter phyllosphaerae]MBB3970114.1 hypothetical protein [Mucilaginibacter phyllosphaerae]TEW66502.1 hypothetical protein E2R65_08730 [Mucilaginibacter phyllosphaerae]GGH09870.1 hypothetical protein GCM10007352_15430 [Mucilaginibacter phyllosphaerae]
MLTKIVKEPTSDKELLNGAEVTQDQLDGLSGNYFLKVHVTSKGRIRRMDASNPAPYQDLEKRDTKTIYFTKEKIEELFKDNPGSDGLKIYLGVHNKDIYPGIRDDNYENKVMVVLVATKGEAEMKDVNDKVMIAGVKSGGMDNGKLCPPDKTC